MEQNYWGKDPGGKLSKLGDFFLCISGLAIVAGIIFLCSAQKSELQTGWTMVGGGISLLLVGLGIGFVGDCVEYRNHLIREQNELLKKQEARVIKKEFEEYEAAKAEAKAKVKAARAEAEAEEKKAE